MNGKGEQGSAVPPPPKDVRIRTMASDIQSMAFRGGGSPQYEKIQLETPQTRKKPTLIPGQPMPREHGMGWVLGWVFGVAAILAALVYFLYPLITQRQPEDSTLVPPNDEEAALPDVPAYLIVPKFTHKTLFISEPNETLSTTLGAPVSGTVEAQIYRDKVLEVLKTAKAESGVIEIDVNKEVNQHLALVEFLKLSGAEFLDLEFLSKNFNSDFTFFVYRDGNNFWPGLVAKLRPGKSKLLLQSEVSNLEGSDKISSLYLNPPGEITSKFKDVLVFGEPARIIDFKSDGARFVYGWFHNFLVVSTSDDGLLDVLLRL